MQLRTYQQQGVKRAKEILSQRGAVYLSEEMGLGKSAESLVIAEGHNSLLIVCPAIMRPTWRKEVLSWTSFAPIVINTGRDRLPQDNSGAAVVISYELAIRAKSLLRPWSVIIYDESHLLKTPTAKRTKFCLGPLWDCTEKRLCLSGSPCPNGIIDGFTVFHKIAPEIFPDRYKFGFRYTDAKRNWFTGHWEFKGANKKNLPELRAKLKKYVMVRRLKKDVLTELPPKAYQQIDIEIQSPEQFRLSPATLAKVLEGQSLVLSEHVATARRALGLLKVPSALEYIKLLLDAKKRLVVFAYHTDVILALEEGLPSGVKVLTVRGATSQSNRQKAIDLFQSDYEGPIVFLGQIQAAGVGITLTKADTCVFVEQDWVPATMAQAVDRLHRIGQFNSVSVQILIASGTMDEQIYGTLLNKTRDIAGAIC